MSGKSSSLDIILESDKLNFEITSAIKYSLTTRINVPYSFFLQLSISVSNA